MKILIVVLLASTCTAQTLKRRTDPPALQPESCPDRVQRYHRSILMSAIHIKDVHLKTQMLDVAAHFQDKDAVVRVCSSRTGTDNLGIVEAYAHYLSVEDQATK